MEISFREINELHCGNLVNYKGEIYSIYDMEEDGSLVYINNPDINNVGLPLSEIKPVLLNEHVMRECGFDVVSEPERVFIGEDIVQTKTKYVLVADEFDIQFSVTIVIDYEMDDNDLFLVKTLDKISSEENSIRYLHQVQNMFHKTYNIDLVSIS